MSESNEELEQTEISRSSNNETVGNQPCNTSSTSQPEMDTSTPVLINLHSDKPKEYSNLIIR